MAKSNIKTKQGFTIIEVVLVLAIAGLIFLMVFVAFPALQRSQRDTRRRDDLARVSTAISQYQANNNGKLPDNGTYTGTENIARANNANGPTRLVENYLNGNQATKNEFVDPDGTYYSIVIETLASGASKSVSTIDHKIYIETYASCDGEVAKRTTSNSKNDYAIMYRLESAGTYCQDSK